MRACILDVERFAADSSFNLPAATVHVVIWLCMYIVGVRYYKDMSVPNCEHVGMRFARTLLVYGLITSLLPNTAS